MKPETSSLKWSNVWGGRENQLMNVFSAKISVVCTKGSSGQLKTLI